MNTEPIGRKSIIRFDRLRKIESDHITLQHRIDSHPKV